MPTDFRPLRSALYLPASNPRAIEKARQLPADAVIFDLEDAVAPEAKADARENLAGALGNPPAARGLRVIRVNGLDSADHAADLELVARCRPDAVLVPKVSHPDDMRRVREALDRAGIALPIWGMIETAAGVLDAAAIAATGEIDCFVVGTNDIAKETGVSTAQERRYLQPWLMDIVLAAKAHGISVLDGVWNDFRDADGFLAEAAQGLAMGFDGKTLIHPSQIEGANRIFAPAPEAVAEAKAIVAAFAEPGNAGKGVINLDGRMVELLHLAMARQLLQRAEAIEALTAPV